MARVEKPRGTGRGVVVAHGARMLHRTPRARRRRQAMRPIGTGTPVTRFLPARLEAYIAPSALIISSSAVRPSSG